LQAVAPLTKTDPAAGPAVGGTALQTAARVNPDTGTQFVLLRHADRAATTDDAATLDWPTADGRYQVPVALHGRDAKVLVAGYDLGGQRLVLSTSEIMTHAAIGGRDVAVLYGTAGAAGTTILRYPSRPRVSVLDGEVASAFDASTGDLRLDYRHDGLARVLVSGGGRRPLLLLLGTDDSVASFWRADTSAGPVLVRGTSLLRSAGARGGVLDLRADTAAPGPIEVFAGAEAVTVNGQPLATRPGTGGSLVGRLPGPQPVTLPALTGWKAHAEAPEAAPGYDDGGWTVADKTSSLSPQPPVTLPVLFSDDYGFHTGSVWYRGHFTATGAETAVSLNAITGKRGNYLVWLDGHYLGSAAGGTEADSDPPLNTHPGPGRFAIPAGLLRPGSPATLAVLVQNMGHNDDWIADDNRFRQPRGLVGAAIDGSAAPIAWRLQGAVPDPVRGPLAFGGLYGERTGWSLPGYDDRTWRPADTPVSAGVTWFRTEFRPNLPPRQDTSVALRFDGPVPAGYRAVLFLNGWNIGQYGADIGPQTDFVLPAGPLREHGTNTLAIAVIATGQATVSTPHLVVLGMHRRG
jgi:hypothetical protein